jgi:hypothetical protein
MGFTHRCTPTDWRVRDVASGRGTFVDRRFLISAAIVLGGATASYVVTGGSVYAAAFAHGVPVNALERMFLVAKGDLALVDIKVYNNQETDKVLCGSTFDQRSNGNINRSIALHIGLFAT